MFISCDFVVFAVTRIPYIHLITCTMVFYFQFIKCLEEGYNCGMIRLELTKNGKLDTLMRHELTHEEVRTILYYVHMIQIFDVESFLTPNLYKFLLPFANQGCIHAINQKEEQGVYMEV